MPKFLRILIYPVVFVVSIFAFTAILFPFDSLKNRVATEIERAMGGDQQVVIGKLSPSLPNGAVLKNVEIRARGETATPPIKLSEAKIKVALMALLSGALEVNFDIKPGEGRATGFFAQRAGGVQVNTKLDRFDLGLVSFLTRRSGFPVTGTISGSVALEVFPRDPLRNAGTASIQILDLGLGGISLANGAFDLPAIRLAAAGSGSKVEVAVRRGNIEVNALQLAGGDLDLDTNGKIYGARRPGNYRFNLKGSFKVTPELADKIQVLGLVEKQKAEDGSYPFTITGRVSKPSIRIGDFKLPI